MISLINIFKYNKTYSCVQSSPKYDEYVKNVKNSLEKNDDICKI
jgi:hypothetical protein